MNEITVKNRYPLPLISSAFELLQGVTTFTKLDLCNAYHLVRIREGDEWRSGFNSPTSHYEYLVMPFGITNAHVDFQALDVLRDTLNCFVFVYLDDILIFSKSRDEYVHHVRAVLQRLLENSLFLSWVTWCLKGIFKRILPKRQPLLLGPLMRTGDNYSIFRALPTFI